MMRNLGTDNFGDEGSWSLELEMDKDSTVLLTCAGAESCGHLEGWPPKI